jgi:hypothetical protein
VYCDKFTSDFSSPGAPAVTYRRDAWCVSERNRCSPVGPRPTTRSQASDRHQRGPCDHPCHTRAEHWAHPEVAAGGPNCWLVVGF